jgi:hypothetical protein
MATAAPLIGSSLVERAVPARGHCVGVLEGAVGDEPQAPASRTRRIARVAFMILPVPETRAPFSVVAGSRSMDTSTTGFLRLP